MTNMFLFVYQILTLNSTCNENEHYLLFNGHYLSYRGRFIGACWSIQIKHFKYILKNINFS